MNRYVQALLVTGILVMGAGCGDDGFGGPYDSCFDGSDCTSSVDGCSIISVSYPGFVATGGICTNECQSDLNCPFDSRGVRGTCLSFDGGFVFTCMEQCVTDLDCPGGFACTDTVPGRSFSQAVCLPAG